MRKTLMLLFIAFCFSMGNVNAQSLPFIEKGKSWHLIEYTSYQYEVTGDFEPPYSEYDMMFREDCDTVINGTTYSRLSCENVHGEMPLRFTEFFREEEGRVYMYYNGKEELLYDFTLNEGDEIELHHISRRHLGEYQKKLKVDKVDYVDVNGKSLKTLNLSGIEGFLADLFEWVERPFKVTWMEGVGDILDPISDPRDKHILSANCEFMPYVLTASHYFIPFSINAAEYHVHAQQLKLGKNVEADIPVENWGKNDLHYEFVDDGTLHISGLMWASSSPNQYMYCYVKPNGINFWSVKDFVVTTKVVEVEPYDSHVGAYYVDLYFDNFLRRGRNYYITDNNGTHMIKYSSDPDAISSPKKYISSVAMPYDLSGRAKGNNATKGIYIKDGKKYIVK